MFGWKTKNRATTQLMAETSGASGGGIITAHGLAAGTRVASNLGWRAVEALTVGDKVLTFDHGMQEITEIRRHRIWVSTAHAPDHSWPVLVPQGALGNRVDLVLLPEQGVLIESDAASDAHGDPFAVLPAQALVGARNIRRVAPVQPTEIITLFFADDQVIYAEGGALIYCPAAHICLSEMMTGRSSQYDVLSVREAVFLVDCLVFEDAALGVPATYAAAFAQPA